MRVAGDDEALADAAERLRPALGGREPGEDLGVAARGRVAEEDAVDVDGQRLRAERARPRLAELAPP